MGSESGDERSLFDLHSEIGSITESRVHFDTFEALSDDESRDYDRDDSEGAVESDDFMETSEVDPLSDHDTPEQDLLRNDYQCPVDILSNVETLLSSVVVQQSDFAQQRENFENIYNGATGETETSAAETLHFFWSLYHLHCDFQDTSSTSQAPILDKDAFKRWQQHRQEVSTGASS